ncbi:uncharacterized protein [Montipora capricornis]|uniref:uncharacterized protein n=1 Tax=Montipora capricornis TaxID=246305 RepID=UPI0035F16345
MDNDDSMMDSNPIAAEIGNFSLSALGHKTGVVGDVILGSRREIRRFPSGPPPSVPEEVGPDGGQAILSDTKTYKKLKADPTSRYKKEFGIARRDLRDHKVIDYALHSKLYPTCDQAPRFYGLPKIHKVNCPLRPIVSSIGTISYQIARYVADILSPLVGETEHHVKNSKAFAEEVRTLQVAPDEELRSYDVSALFTSVPVNKALVLIHKKLEEDYTLKDRTPMAPKDVVTLLGLCLTCTYFLYQDHLNSIDDDIKWTTEGEVETHSEDNNTERALAFLDTWSVINEDGTIKTRVYRKATHTDQYLNFESNHPLEHKRGVVRTLAHRAESIVSDPKDREGEIDHVRTALSYNGYPSWLLKDPKQPAEEQQPSSQAATLPSSGTSKKKYPVVMPYIRGFSEELRRILKGYNIPAYFKPSNTLRQLLVRPKDKMNKLQVTGTVYHIPCEDCPASYVGETERSFKAQFMEHRRPSSSTSKVSRHIHTTEPGHSIDIANAEILEVEPRWFERGVKEAIHIRTLCPSLNKDGGRYNLSPIWTNLLRNRGREAARKPSNFQPTSEDDVTNNTSHVTKSSGELESL